MAFCCTQLLLPSDGPSFYRLWSTDGPECVVEDPFGRDFHRMIEHVRKERNSSNTKLNSVSSLSQGHSSIEAVLTPMGPHVLNLAFLMFFFAYSPEYRTMLCMVNAGSPILATLWNTALCAATALQSSIAGTRPGDTSPPVKLVPFPTIPPALMPDVSTTVSLRLLTFSKMLPWAVSCAVSGCSTR